MKSFDPEFRVWLQTLPSLGYEPDWVQRNMVILQNRFAKDRSPMPPCPPSPNAMKARDRYEEL